MTARAMLEVRDVTKRFGAIDAVGGITFAVGEGEIVGFLGPNGAGKTTTMRILAGIFPPTSGEVRIAGHDPQRHPLACRRAVGYFPEHAPYYPELSVRGYLRLVARLKRLPRATRGEAVARVLAACGLEAVAHRRVGTLSKGYRQRVGLAQALCGDPPILILDEPTIGLDPAQVVEIREPGAGPARQPHRALLEPHPHRGGSGVRARDRDRPRPHRGRGHARRAGRAPRAQPARGHLPRPGA